MTADQAIKECIAQGVTQTAAENLITTLVVHGLELTVAAPLVSVALDMESAGLGSFDQSLSAGLTLILNSGKQLTGEPKSEGS